MSDTAIQYGGEARERPIRMPGEEGIWVFILGDLLVFALLFLVYLYYRGDDPVLYGEAQRWLNPTHGLINTLLLLTSSWCVAQAVTAVRRGWNELAPILLASAFFLGLGFVGVKIVEYSEKISAGITIITNDFFMFYYMLTGIHLLHLLIGLGVLGFLFSVSRRPTVDQHVSTLESGGAFWHLIDLLWIVLFALLYLVK